MTYIEDSFEPYLIYLPPMGMRFMVGTPTAQRLYDPMDKPLFNEIDWIMKNVDISFGRKVIDGGCHHGLYSVALGWHGAWVFAVDLHKPNVDMAMANCAINGVNMNWGHAAIANTSGLVRCTDSQLGALVEDGNDTVRAVTLPEICPDANIVKLDIEGAEFLVLPEALDTMPKVDTWIVEIHPWWFEVSGEKDLFTPFLEHGFDLLWVDRAAEDPKVVPMNGREVFKMQSTVIAIRRD